MSTTTPALSLPELRAQLDAVLAAYPELRRGGRQLLADIDRQLSAPAGPTSSQIRNRTRYTEASRRSEGGRG